MIIPKTAKLDEIYCNGTNKRGRRCGRYLGRFQSEGCQRYGDYTCANCGTTTQIYLDELGIQHRDYMAKNKKLRTPSETVYVTS